MPIVAGIDGCPGGWLRITYDRDAALIGCAVFPSAESLFADAANFAFLAIDIPIGLSADGWRPCDTAARKLLSGPRASSVFPAPPRGIISARNYQEAVEQCLAASGKKITRQSFAILDRIKEVDCALQNSRLLREKVREIHPEVCFYFLNGRRPMQYPKRTVGGAAERETLVENVFGTAFTDIRAQIHRRLATDDDIRDALVAAWTAGRIADGVAESVSGECTVDRTGLVMDMSA
jgi:predicted RNase H-like nuclease